MVSISKSILQGGQFEDFAKSIKQFNIPMSVIRTPNFKIRDMVYSGSNSKIFCACSDRTIRLLDPRKVTGSVEYVEYIDQEPIQTLQQEIWALFVSPNSEIILACCQTKTIIYRIEDDQLEPVQEINASFVTASFTQNSKYVLLSKPGCQVYFNLYNPEKSFKKLELNYHIGRIDKTGEKILLLSQIGQLFIYNQQDMLLIQNYDFKITEIKDFIYLMQSNKVVICSNRQIFIANLADLNAGPTKLNLKRGEFLQAQVSADEKICAMLTDYPMLFIWNLKVNESGFEIQVDLQTHLLPRLFLCNRMNEVYIYQNFQKDLLKFDLNQQTEEYKVFQKFECNIGHLSLLDNDLLTQIDSGELFIIDSSNNLNTNQVYCNKQQYHLQHLVKTGENIKIMIITQAKQFQLVNLQTQTIEMSLEMANCSILHKDNQIIIIGLEEKPYLQIWSLETKNITFQFADLNHPVTSLLWLDKLETRLAVGNSQGTIKIIQMEPEPAAIKSLKGHTKQVNVMVMSVDEKLMFSGSQDGTIRVWDIKAGIQYKCLTGHNGSVDQILFDSTNWKGEVQQFAITLSKRGEKNIIIWSLQEFIPLNSLRWDAQFIAIHPKYNIIYCASKTLIKVFKNPLIQNDNQSFQIHPNDSYSPMLIAHIKKLILDQQTIYDQDYNKYLFMPYRISPIHILAARNRVQDIKLALKKNHPFTATAEGLTILSIALENNNIELIQVVIKQLAKFIDSGVPISYEHIGRCIVQLNQNSYQNLETLYNSLYPTDYSLKRFGVPLYEQLQIAASLQPCIDSNTFIVADSGASKEVPLSYRRSLVELDLTSGSYQSLELLQSLADCKNGEIFRTPMIQMLLDFKWQKVRKFFTFIAFLYIGLIVMLSIHTLGYRNEIVIIYAILIFNSLFMIYEFLQIIHSFTQYISDIWNILDLSRICVIYLYCSLEILQEYTSDQTQDLLLTLVSFISWARLVSYIRLIDKARYLIRMIQEIVKDMAAFFMILFVATLAVAMTLTIDSGNSMSFKDSLLHVLLLNFSSFEMKDNGIYYCIFIIASIFNPLILLNLLIAIMGDTYERVQQTTIQADYQEKTNMILDIEVVMYWNRNKTQRYYLHQCNIAKNEDDDEETWEGRLIAVSKEVKQVQLFQKTIMNNEKTIKEKIDKTQDRVADLLRKLRDFNGSFTDVDKLEQDLETLLK